eukprot:CAMPEP_0168846884 /NCGR_PEP_ID=MMETSP0727-20121128/10033_1 /TAXON_ID=265536 /ORGANISM="Amphiprora sp., Strain CCMP467" /LENGTH=164 /DNA_ID=CAMNT_0008900673 /DNA_START=105 /DNA_END=596 /DNA_ORIENTATION=-
MNRSMPVSDDESNHMEIIQDQPCLNPVGYETPDLLAKIFDLETKMENGEQWSFSINDAHKDDWGIQPSSTSLGDESSSSINSDLELLEWIPDFSEDGVSEPMDEDYLSSSDQGVHQKKLLEFMKRTSRTRASLAIVTPTTEAYHRKQSVSHVISSVRESSSRVV